MRKQKKPSKNTTSFFTSPRWAYVGSFLFSVVLIYLALRFEHRLTHLKSLGLFGIFLINLIASSTVIVPAPAIVSVVIGGRLYSPFLVGLFAALGAGIGNMIGYFLGRSGTHIVLNNSQHRWYRWLKKNFHTYGTMLIFIFALVPNPFFDAIALVAGIAEYPPVKFFFLMLVARIIRDTLLAFLGGKV